MKRGMASFEERLWLQVSLQHPEFSEPVACSIVDVAGKQIRRWLGEGLGPEHIGEFPWQESPAVGEIVVGEDDEEEMPPYDVSEQWEQAYRFPLVLFAMDYDLNVVIYRVRWEIGRGLVFDEAKRGVSVPLLPRREAGAGLECR